MSKSLGESSHSHASESPALAPAHASKDQNQPPAENVKKKSKISPVQFCSSATIFNPQIEKIHRNERKKPPRAATPLTLATLSDDRIKELTAIVSLPTTSFLNKPVKSGNMGNIFGRKKKKNVSKEDDDDIWKKMGASDSSSSLSGRKNKKKKKKKGKKSTRQESPSPSRGRDSSQKGKDPKRYAVYEPQPQSKDVPVAVRSRTLPARIDPSEFRKSIGDPMDFRMADDVSSAGSPGQATPETATPPIRKSPVPIYKKIHLPRDKNTEQTSPKMKQKEPVTKSVEQTSDANITENKKPPHQTPTPGTGSPRPRGYILPSPPSRPKFHSTEPGSASPRLLRVKPQKPIMINTSSDDASYSNSAKLAVLRGKANPNTAYPGLNIQNKIVSDDDTPAKLVACPGGVCLRQPVNRKRINQEALDMAAMQIENEENERNLKREERRKMAEINDLKGTSKLEECSKIQETVLETVEPHIAESEKHEATSGPKIAILSTIPPPEKAVLTHVPPPSPSAMDALCEENEEEEEEETDNNDQVTMRRSKEVEEFGGIVCQRLSQLLESQDDGTLRLQFVESSGPSSSLSPASPGMIMSGSDVDRERMEDAGQRFSSLSPPVETENVYKEKAIPRKQLCVEMTKPSTFSQRLERSSISTRSTQGSNSASDIDGRCTTQSFKTNSRDNANESESDLSSSEEESSYTSDSEYSSHGSAGIATREKADVYRENEYSVPWDLQRYSRDESYTDECADLSDNQTFGERERNISHRHTQREHAQRIARQGLKRSENFISDSAEYSDCDYGMWDEYAHGKCVKTEGSFNKQRQMSVEELVIEPVKINRKLFQLPKKFSSEEIQSEIVEDEIKRVQADSNESSSVIPKRGSEILYDVIDSYTAEEMAAMRRMAPAVPPKRQSNPCDEIIIEPPVNPSALDKSLKKIFSEEVEEKYPELAPLHSLILDAEEGGTSSAEPFLDFRPGQLPTFTRVPFGSRRSLTYTESDLDMSEQRDDVSSDNMDADDEDDEECSGIMRLEGTNDGDELVYGRTYSELENLREVKVSKKVLNTAFRESDDNDSVFLEDLYDPAPRLPAKPLAPKQVDIPLPPLEFDLPPPVPVCQQNPPSPSHPSHHPLQHVNNPSLDLTSTYYVMGPPTEAVDVAFDDAWKQMQDIHDQLKTLRDQMDHLTEDSPGVPRSPGSAEPRQSRRESKDTRDVVTD